MKNNKLWVKAKEEFEQIVVLEGYNILGEYVNNRTKNMILCPVGHEYNVTPNAFKSGNRCPKCSGKCPVQAKEQFIVLLKQEGYELISEYKLALEKVKLKCSVGHIYDVRPNDFKNGIRCPKCDGQCPAQAKERFIQTLTQEGYVLLGEYINSGSKVGVKCPNGHMWEVRPSDLRNFVRCPHCAGSTGQHKLQEMLLSHINELVLYNNRKVLNGLELDIYYPNLGVAIEYNGNYWHNKPKQIERDERKKLLCKEKGIKLIEVWDDDFMKSNITELNRVVDVMGSL